MQKKIISILLLICLLVSLIPEAIAEGMVLEEVQEATENDGKVYGRTVLTYNGTSNGTETVISSADYAKLPYKNYVAIGDSVSWGYGIQPEWIPSGEPSAVGRRNEGAFPDLIGKVLEENNNASVRLAVCSGSRLSQYRTLFETSLGYEKPYVHEGDEYGERNYERGLVLQSKGPEYVEWLRGADLVTFELGFNDITASLVNTLGATGAVDMSRIVALETEDDILAYVMYALENTDFTPEVLTKIETALERELTGIGENARAVLGEIGSIVPADCDIIVVGYYDVISRFTVVPGTESVIFNLLNYMIVTLNDCFSAAADEYDNVYFVPAADAEILIADGSTVTEIASDMSNFTKNIHPSIEGHRYIAKTVLDALNELNICHHENVKTIKQSVRSGWLTGIVDVKVCGDCGEILSWGKLKTAFGTYDVPEQTIKSIAKTAAGTVGAITGKLTSGISALLGR